MVKRTRTALAPIEHVSRAILVLRGERILLDTELAALYGVTTKRLNEQVKRNSGRFPADFVFRLTRVEIMALNRSQTATGSQKHRDPRFPPYAFTEHGALMAATVLNSSRAEEMTIYVVRAFLRYRAILTANEKLAAKLDELERKLHSQDKTIIGILRTLRELMSPPTPRRRPIGFTADLTSKS